MFDNEGQAVVAELEKDISEGNMILHFVYVKL